MKISRKVEIAKQAIRSISQHDDAEELSVADALQELVAFIEEERVAMEVRHAEKRANE